MTTRRLCPGPIRLILRRCIAALAGGHRVVAYLEKTTDTVLEFNGTVQDPEVNSGVFVFPEQQTEPSLP